MKIEETREAMMQAIRSVSPAGKGYSDYVEELCDRLMEAGAFVPPVKCGETVFAAYPKLNASDEDIIDEYKVRGCGVTEDGDIFILDADKEINIVCDMYCNFTREDAEMWFKKEKRDE